MKRETRLAVGDHACPADLRGRRCHVIVSTPLQYLNAKELIEYLDCSEHYLVILEEYYAYRDFRDLPGFSGWTATALIDGRRKTSPCRLWRGIHEILTDRSIHRQVARLICQWPASDLVVIGNAQALTHHDFIVQGHGQEVLICEDGTASITSNATWRSHAKRLRKWLLGIRGNCVSDAWWFTAYPHALTDRKILHNRYAYLRTLVTSRQLGKQQTGTVWFLGQPLIELGVSSRQMYGDLLQSIDKAVYADCRLLYWPHPREHRDNLEWLARTVGIEVVERSGPIELELLRRAEPPARVATLYSSAYQTCQAIFADAVPFDIFEPCTDDWPVDHLEVGFMRDCYAYFRQHVRSPHRFFHQQPSRHWHQLDWCKGNPQERSCSSTGSEIEWPATRGTA